MSIDAPPKSTARRFPFARLDAFPDLFQTYCADYDAVADFYAGDFRDRAARRAAADRAVDHERDRDRLADMLLEQNERWGLDEKTRTHIETLRDPASVAVVTGQQVGLLTGPLYTPYKIITTLGLTRQLAEETNRPVVPVFWIEGEDHDFAEVAGLQLLRRNELVRLRYDRPAGDDQQPAGRHVFTEQIDALITQIDETLPDSDFKPALMDKVCAAYQPGVRLEDAFARFVRALFPEAGLVFVNPDDARLKEQVAPLFRRELTEYAAITERLRATSEKLETAYHAQVRIKPTNLFLLEDDGRWPLDTEVDGRFTLRGVERTFTEDELLALLDEAPERFSPNVLLRPLMQDALLPTAAYVAGPSEVSYFAQLKPAYEWADLPMPLLYPRASATLVESKVQKVLRRYEMDVPDVEQGTDKLFQRVVVDAMEVDVDALFEDAMRQLHQAVNGLKPQVERVDSTLGPSAEATREALAQELEQLKSRVVRAEKHNQDEVHDQLEKAHLNLFPEGQLQERAVNVLYFLNKYSLDLSSRLQQELSLDTTAHQVVEL